MPTRSRRSATPLLRRSTALIGISVCAPLVYAGVAGATIGTCSQLTNHWYGQAWAAVGNGNTNGSEVVETLPSSYYESDGGTDEAAWNLNWTWFNDNVNGDTTYNGSWEFGYFYGVWPYNPSDPVYTSPTLYQTVDAGTVGAILATSLTEEDQIQFKIANVDTNCPTRSAYDVTASSSVYLSTACGPGGSSGTAWIVPDDNRQDFSQGEVVTTDDPPTTWMGGNEGDGVVNYLYYEDVLTDEFHAWGSIDSMCDDSPYWVNSESAAYAYANGGPSS